jgi:hypothetical protein
MVLLHKPQSDRPDEPSRDGALRSLLMREDLSDVTLRGSDGVLVIANRCILASRSSVFGGMLYGPFKEASNNVVDVDYEGKIIQTIVNYIYTDELLSIMPANITNVQQEKDDFDGEQDTSEHPCNYLVRFVMVLIDASEYFALSALRRMIEISAKELMLKNDNLATLFMAACAPDCEVTKGLRDAALGLVKKNPSLLIHGAKSVVEKIHPMYVEEILKQERLPMKEHSCFQILQAWATAEVERQNGDKNVSIAAATEPTNVWINNRKRIASEMISHIHLENISPTDLSTIVAPSGLVSVERLCDAYKTQALRSEKSGKRMRRCYEQFRGAYAWMYSGIKTVVARKEIGEVNVSDVLDCPLMKSGVHKWRIKVVKGNGHALGVLATRPPDGSFHRSRASFASKGAWTMFKGEAVVGRRGWENRKILGRLPCEIRTGSIVSFSLDLDRGGILTVSIDEDAPFEVFSGMCKETDVEEGFLPIVTAMDGSVRFLGFEQDDVYF